MDFINNTPFAAAPFLLVNARGLDTLLVVVKGTWHIGTRGGLTVAEEQDPVRAEPVYCGTPGASSLVYDTDVVLEKVGTDCALIGHAWAPSGKVSHVDVTFAVGPVRKTVRAFGERIWIRCLGVVSKSKPAPFEKLPLVYERAFGGSDASAAKIEHHEVCPHNPVGRGFLARKTRTVVHGMRLPNLEDPSCLISRPGQRPPAAGFGFIPPHWQPRAGYAGTYDENWRKAFSPLPAPDLDPRFFSAAAPGLVAPRPLEGNERVLVEGASQRGRLVLSLPGLAPSVRVRLRNAEEGLTMRLDTVVVEPDAEKVLLTWRGSLVVHGSGADPIRACVDVSGSVCRTLHGRGGQA